MAETERLNDSSEIFVLNATALPVDVFVNYESQPTISDPTPLVGEFANADEMTPTVFVVKGTTKRPYGAYTFSIRTKGDATGEVLATASIVLQQGHSFSGVFHPLPTDGYQFSIYENDLSDGGDARLTVRNAGRPQQVSWELQSNGEPASPPDRRSGTLQHGEWQIARNVIDNGYAIEFFIGGVRVARLDDLRLAVEKNIIVYLIGDPQPTDDPQLLLRPVCYQELEFDAGPVAEAVTTPPAPPLSTTDTNTSIQFNCEAVELWQTSTATALVSAVDPDGVVTNLSIDHVDPPVGGIDILGGAVAPATAIGKPATAEVTFKSDLPGGVYQVWIVANLGGMGHRATCILSVTVKPITIARLRGQIDFYQASGDIQDTFADSLLAILVQAQQHLDAGDTSQACADLKGLLTAIGSEKGKAISDPAHDDLSQEMKALRTDLGCG